MPSVRARAVVACLVAALLPAATGCMFQNLSAAQRLNESTFVLNDAARWGRLDVARSYVAPGYLGRYAHRHQHWGSQIQIAEADIVSMQLDEDKEAATSRVQVAWYSTDTMSLRASTIVQRWIAEGQNYLLVGEELRGDPQLFAAEAAPAAAEEPEGPEPVSESAAKPVSEAVAADGP